MIGLVEKLIKCLWIYTIQKHTSINRLQKQNKNKNKTKQNKTFLFFFSFSFLPLLFFFFFVFSCFKKINLIHYNFAQKKRADVAGFEPHPFLDGAHRANPKNPNKKKVCPLDPSIFYHSLRSREMGRDPALHLKSSTKERFLQAFQKWSAVKGKTSLGEFTNQVLLLFLRNFGEKLNSLSFFQFNLITFFLRSRGV